MNKLQAIQCLYNKSHAADFQINEWTEAGLWNAVVQILDDSRDELTEEDVDQLLVAAANN